MQLHRPCSSPMPIVPLARKGYANNSISRVVRTIPLHYSLLLLLLLLFLIRDLKRKLTMLLCLADPTIKYYHDGDSKGEDYKGGRDFDSLKEFVENELEIKCNTEDGSGCTDKEKGYIEKMKAKVSDDRVKQIKRLEGMAGDSMKAELKNWLRQRLHILRMLEK